MRATSEGENKQLKGTAFRTMQCKRRAASPRQVIPMLTARTEAQYEISDDGGARDHRASD
jgi:hypothetical protein